MTSTQYSGQKGSKQPNQGIRNLFNKLSKRERQIAPSQHEEYSGSTKENDRTNAEARKAEREEKKAKKEEVNRMKDIERQDKLTKRGFRKTVKQDLAQTSHETCITFICIVAVGTFFFGGGTALIKSGRENTIVDFIVVGVCGIIIGAVFTAAGLVLIFKPIYDNYKDEQRELKTAAGIQKPSGQIDMPFYFDDVQRTLLKAEIRDDGRRSRRPSNAELYGDVPPGHPDVGGLQADVIDPRKTQVPPCLAFPHAVSRKVRNDSKEPAIYLQTIRDPDQTSTAPENSITSTAAENPPTSNVAENPITSNAAGNSFTSTAETRSKSGSESGSSIDLQKPPTVINTTCGSSFHPHTDLLAGFKDVDKMIYDDLSQDSSPILKEHLDSPVVVVTPDDQRANESNDGTKSKPTIIVDNNDGSKSKPTIIVDNSLSREQSSTTVRSHTRTPSSIMLTYDKDTFESK